MNIDLLRALSMQFAIGGLGGLCIGYLITRVAVIINISMFAAVFGLNHLVQEDIIKADFGVVQAWAENLAVKVAAIEFFLKWLPFTAGF